MKPYFTNEFVDFFKELAPNNNKDWFDVNRKRYKTHVKDTFEVFVIDLIEMVKKHDKEVNVLPKNCIFRINRDVRFSKNKEPYKIQMSAVVNAGGKKNTTKPGIYVEVTPEWVRIYMGFFQPSKEQLFSLRTAMANKTAAFNKLIKDKEFIKIFGEVRGAKNVRIDKSLQEAAKKQELIFNKSFYFFHQMDPENALQEGFVEKIEKIYLTGKGLSDFLDKGMN